MTMIKAKAEGYSSVNPILTFKDARKAIDFYKRAFGARERMILPGPGGIGVMHAELQIGDSVIMMGEENPQTPCRSAETLGTSPVSFYIYVEDADEAFKTAIAAGATVRMPVQDMFWGDRAGTLEDPFGYGWFLATHTRDLTAEQIQEGAKAMFCDKGAE
jgi:PhnB protein